MSQGSGGMSNNLKNHHHRISAASASANAQSSSSTMANAAANTSINASGGTPNHSSTEGDDTINFPYCDDVNKYEKIGKIGQGMKLETRF